MLLNDRWSYCCNLMEGCDVGQYEGGQFAVICIADIDEEGAEFCINGLVDSKERLLLGVVDDEESVGVVGGVSV